MIRIDYNCRAAIALLFALASSLCASNVEDLKQADTLFEVRSRGLDEIHQAKSLYLKIVKDKKAPNEMRTYALDRYGRLAVYEGEVAKVSLGVNDAAEIFRKCLDATDYLRPKKSSDMTAEYAYWRSMCIGLWAANANKFDITMHVKRVTSELPQLLEIGMQRFRRYDDYGFNRIKAGMYIRSKLLVAFNLYHPEWSLDLLTESIKDGCDNYMTYILLAETFDALGDRARARETLESAIDELKQKMVSGTIPSILKAENDVFLLKMYVLLAEYS